MKTKASNIFNHPIISGVTMGFIFASLFFISASMSGCASAFTEDKEARNQQILKAITDYTEPAVSFGVSLLLSDKPEAREYVIIAHDAITIALADNVQNPDAVMELIIYEIRGAGGEQYAPLVASSLNMAWQTYKRFYKENVGHSERTRAVREILKHARSGIASALATGGVDSPASPPVPPAEVKLEGE